MRKLFFATLALSLAQISLVWGSAGPPWDITMSFEVPDKCICTTNPVAKRHYDEAFDELWAEIKEDTQPFEKRVASLMQLGQLHLASYSMHYNDNIYMTMSAQGEQMVEIFEAKLLASAAQLAHLQKFNLATQDQLHRIYKLFMMGVIFINIREIIEKNADIINLINYESILNDIQLDVEVYLILFQETFPMGVEENNIFKKLMFQYLREAKESYEQFITAIKQAQQDKTQAGPVPEVLLPVIFLSPEQEVERVILKSNLKFDLKKFLKGLFFNDEEVRIFLKKIKGRDSLFNALAIISSRPETAELVLNIDRYYGIGLALQHAFISMKRMADIWRRTLNIDEPHQLIEYIIHVNAFNDNYLSLVGWAQGLLEGQTRKADNPFADLITQDIMAMSSSIIASDQPFSDVALLTCIKAIYSFILPELNDKISTVNSDPELPNYQAMVVKYTFNHQVRHFQYSLEDHINIVNQLILSVNEHFNYDSLTNSKDCARRLALLEQDKEKVTQFKDKVNVTKGYIERIIKLLNNEFGGSTLEGYKDEEVFLKINLNKLFAAQIKPKIKQEKFKQVRQLCEAHAKSLKDLEKTINEERKKIGTIKQQLIVTAKEKVEISVKEKQSQQKIKSAEDLRLKGAQEAKVAEQLRLKQEKDLAKALKKAQEDQIAQAAAVQKEAEKLEALRKKKAAKKLKKAAIKLAEESYVAQAVIAEEEVESTVQDMDEVTQQEDVLEGMDLSALSLTENTPEAAPEILEMDLDFRRLNLISEVEDKANLIFDVSSDSESEGEYTYADPYPTRKFQSRKRKFSQDQADQAEEEFQRECRKYDKMLSRRAALQVAEMMRKHHPDYFNYKKLYAGAYTQDDFQQDKANASSPFLEAGDSDLFNTRSYPSTPIKITAPDPGNKSFPLVRPLFNRGETITKS